MSSESSLKGYTMTGNIYEETTWDCDKHKIHMKPRSDIQYKTQNLHTYLQYHF